MLKGGYQILDFSKANVLASGGLNPEKVAGMGKAVAGLNGKVALIHGLRVQNAAGDHTYYLNDFFAVLSRSTRGGTTFQTVFEINSTGGAKWTLTLHSDKDDVAVTQAG